MELGEDKPSVVVRTCDGQWSEKTEAQQLDLPSHFQHHIQASCSAHRQLTQQTFCYLKISISLFQALAFSIHLDASETWTLQTTDMKTLEAFYLKCIRQIPEVCWHQHITNSEILSHAGCAAFRLGFPTSCLMDFMEQGKIIEAEVPTVRVGATPIGLTAPPPPQRPKVFYRPDALPATQPTAM